LASEDARRPDDTGNTANKKPKAADRRPKQNQAGPSRASHAASDSHFSDTDAGQNIRQNTDTIIRILRWKLVLIQKFENSM
jgi:hypothetical protein